MRVGYTKTQSALEVSFSSNGLNSQTQNAALSLEGDKLSDACNTVIGFENDNPLCTKPTPKSNYRNCSSHDAASL